MTEPVSVEASGETVSEAKWKALRELERLAPGLDKAGVRFQVVDEGERGLLGVGTTPARVVATAEAGVPRVSEPREGESPDAAHARAIVERIVAAIGAGTEVDVDESPSELLVTCTGGDLALVIGRHGQTIDAIQHVTNAVLWRAGAETSVTVDAAGYRDRRRAALEELAVDSARRARDGEKVALEPMTAVERKIVHERLKELGGVLTSSIGNEPNRYIVVVQAEPDA